MVHPLSSEDELADVLAVLVASTASELAEEVDSSAALLEDAAAVSSAELDAAELAAAELESALLADDVAVLDDPQPANRVATIAALTRDATTFCFMFDSSSFNYKSLCFYIRPPRLLLAEASYHDKQ